MEHLEVASKRSMLTRWRREADFVFDLTTFKVLKHRYDVCEMTPQQAHEWLTFYLEQPHIRILLLVD